jgi:hypothetical protein
MRFFFFACCLIFSFLANAQETTIGKRNNEAPKDTTLEARLVLLVPFEKTMYRSDADMELANASNMSVPEMRAYIRYEMQKHLEKALAGKSSSYNLLSDNPLLKKDLDYLYYSCAYKYEAVEGTEEPSSGSPKNGQLTTNTQSGNRYMNRTVSNPKSLAVLHKRYGTDFFVFINQFDIAPAPGTDQNDIMNESFNREIKVHYTVITKEGKQVDAGTATALFPYKKKKIAVIINDCFPAIAQKVTASVITTNPENKN